ncbi:MAG: hypothetical protein DMG17_01680 [Acidobacteria bacterium]|nr:MAG: hypothetical protein DMG17_01680 [Acidobacteriota bacterium]
MANDQFPGGSRRLWWLAAIAYGLANILLHEPANDIAKRLVVVLGLQLFLWSTRAFFLAGAVLVLFLCRHLLRDSQTVRRLLIFIPFAAALDLSLVIYPSERIHYPQYAILTWMAFKAGGQALPAVLLSFIFGYLDEANQHWVLYANDPIAYFDWNDVVLNLLAALGGLVLLPQENVRKVPTKRILAAAGAWTLGMSLLVFLLNPDPYLMRSQKTDSFWLVSRSLFDEKSENGFLLAGIECQDPLPCADRNRRHNSVRRRFDRHCWTLLARSIARARRGHSPPRRGGRDARSR